MPFEDLKDLEDCVSEEKLDPDDRIRDKTKEVLREEKYTEDLLNKSTIYYNNLRLSSSYNFKALNIVKDLEKFKSFNMIITSKTNSGKSVFTNDIVYQIRNWYTHVYVFSMTSYLQPDLFNYVPKENIFNIFDESKLDHIWTKQMELVMSLKKIKIDEDKIPRVLIIYDDLISDPKVKNSEILKRMFVAGRHVKISQIFLTQSFTAIPPILRKNCAIAVAFYLDSYVDREAFAKSYLSTKNVKLGIMIFDRITKVPYTAICVLNCLVSGEPEEYIRSYKATLSRPKFKIGSISNNKTLKNSFLNTMPSAPIDQPLDLRIRKN